MKDFYSQKGNGNKDVTERKKSKLIAAKFLSFRAGRRLPGGLLN